MIASTASVMYGVSRSSNASYTRARSSSSRRARSCSRRPVSRTAAPVCAVPVLLRLDPREQVSPDVAPIPAELHVRQAAVARRVTDPARLHMQQLGGLVGVEEP